ncbi:hypothetical protein LOK49_LG06G01002 [Camellia lanceoleosa]|uniref:Uncharacterized protein n=1 Tax=Camellia lanceoleosa TaxID=1840588 RepID=A0ACC0HEP4_9ERIC|nr:hypothetical protein LOK49_LG06G01002 [Camellia lanceoleosa]
MLKVIAGRDGAKRKNSKQQIETRVLESIVIASFTIVTALVILPCEYINGSPVPTLIFKGLPFTFQAFVVSLAIAIAASLSALLIHDHNNSFLTKLCRFISIGSITSALSLLLCAIFNFVFLHS